MTATVVPASDPGALELAAAAMRRGDVVAIPTETVYGVASLPMPAALEKLVAIKRRSSDKGVALLIDSAEQMHQFAVVPAAAQRLAQAFWPGPLTLILEALPGRDLPELLTGGRPTVGLRLPDHEVPRRLCRALGPFAASSANISGQPDATTAGQVAATLGDEVALILDDGPVRGGLASTVVAVTAAEPVPTILRLGALSSDDIARAAG